MTLLMILQQKLTPTTGDSTQQKMMMIMPIVMLFMFYNLPSGLTLYWTVSNIFSILQMKYGQFAAKRDEARQGSKPQKA
jgi:YidC/Oxa1 family membrane protein insertase